MLVVAIGIQTPTFDLVRHAASTQLTRIKEEGAPVPDWKLLWLSSKPRWLVQPTGADQWGLYNLAEDPAEANNLIEQEPEKFAELLAQWEQYSEEQGVILPEWQ